MTRKTVFFTTMLMISGLLFSIGNARATMIPITNSGFEIPSQSNGHWTTSLPNGWQLYTDNMQLSYAYGVWNPDGSYYSGTAPDGRNVGYLEGSVGETGIFGFEQTLGATLAANTTYNLQVAVGNTSWYNGFPGYRVELLAGGAVLASDDNTLSPAEDSFLTSSVMFTALSSDPNLGDALTIRLLNLSDGSGREVDFDHVRLTATSTPIPSPEPGTLLLLGFGLVGLAALRRKE